MKILTQNTITDYIIKYFPETLWWDGTKNKWTPWIEGRSFKHRQGMPNEIRIEFDYEDSNKNWKAINFTSIELEKLGYSFAIFSVEGGRGPHLHLYDLDELEQLTKEQRRIYRVKFLKKVCGDYQADEELCNESHMCALEFAIHFKHNKPKQLLSYLWNGRNSGIDFDIKHNLLHQKPAKIKPVKQQHQLKFGEIITSNRRDLIIDRLNFETVFDKYNIKYKGKMALCPFHADKDNSLSFSNEKGLWKCFGCNARGDIISLIKKLREMK